MHFVLWCCPLQNAHHTVLLLWPDAVLVPDSKAKEEEKDLPCLGACWGKNLGHNFVSHSRLLIAKIIISIRLIPVSEILEAAKATSMADNDRFFLSTCSVNKKCPCVTLFVLLTATAFFHSYFKANFWKIFLKKQAVSSMFHMFFDSHPLISSLDSSFQLSRFC